MRISKRCVNNISQKIEVEKNWGHMKCRYRIIGKLISIKVLWEFFLLNTPIKDELYIVFIIMHHYTSSYIIIHHHTRSLSSPLSILWIQVSRESSSVKSLSGSQSSPALLSGHNSPTLLNPYLELQGSPTLPSSQLFQNRSRHVHTSGPMVLGNP